MDLKQLEYFVRVAELGSFTRAAVALDVAQPALSRQVRLLEVELRQNLLTRNGRGAAPTEAGKLLLEHGRGILHQVERAREELGRVRGALAGRVALGLPPSVAKAMAVPLIREFRQRMPDATLSISEGLSVGMQESLVTGRLDIALLYNASPVARHRTHAAAGGAAVPGAAPNRQGAAVGQAPARALARGRQAAAGHSQPAQRHPHAGGNRDGQPGLPARRWRWRSTASRPSSTWWRTAPAAPILSRNAVATSAHPQAFAIRPIGAPALRSKLALAMSSQRPATLTQKAMCELIARLAPALLAGR